MVFLGSAYGGLLEKKLIFELSSRADSTVVKKHSSKLAELINEYKVFKFSYELVRVWIYIWKQYSVKAMGNDSFIPLDCSAIILEHLLNSFYSLSNLRLENIECLMLMHTAQKYECAKTRDHCIKQLRKVFSSPDPMTALIALDIVSRYAKVSKKRKFQPFVLIRNFTSLFFLTKI